MINVDNGGITTGHSSIDDRFGAQAAPAADAAPDSPDLVPVGEAKISQSTVGMGLGLLAAVVALITLFVLIGKK